jgi:SH3-like domain-containing protein
VLVDAIVFTAHIVANEKAFCLVWTKPLGRLNIGRFLFAALAIAVAGGIVYAFTENQNPQTLSTANAAQDKKPAARPVNTQTGLPLPRFVSLKSERVNVRRGPSNEHGVVWVFTQKSLPVEIIAEFDHWRRIRDSEGAEGWVYHSLLTGRRTVIAAPWSSSKTMQLRADASASAELVARIGSGALGDLKSCDGKWCLAAFSGYEGYVSQETLFGVYPGEVYEK